MFLSARFSLTAVCKCFCIAAWPFSFSDGVLTGPVILWKYQKCLQSLFTSCYDHTVKEPCSSVPIYQFYVFITSSDSPTNVVRSLNVSLRYFLTNVSKLSFGSKLRFIAVRLYCVITICYETPIKLNR